MLEIHLMEGPKAGTVIPVRHFPFTIGRSAEADLQLEAAGVWDRHGVLHYKAGEGFYLEAGESSSVLLNDHPVDGKVRLPNRSQVVMGAAKMVVALEAPRQISATGRTVLFWGLVLGLMALQVWIVYLLR